MARSSNWNLSKSSKALASLFVSILIAYVIPRYFSPAMETLVLVSKEKHFIYTICFGFTFLVFGEMTGIFEQRLSSFNFLRSSLFIITAFLASLSLLLIVWIFEYKFIGRYAILKIGIFTGLGNFFLFWLFNKLVQKNPLKILLKVPAAEEKKIKSEFKNLPLKFFSFNKKSPQDESELIKFCKKDQIDLVVIENGSEAEKLEIVALLQIETRVIGIVELWENYLEKIPADQVNQSWLAKLDLRFRDPLFHNSKRIIDLIVAFFGLIITLPIILISLLFIIVESGLPIFFSQKRTGFLGRSYVLYKLRTMQSDAEQKEAKWAMENDLRVTKVGHFLRKWRIDEIPQFWNVIKGEMSIVGPRPERPEFQEELMDKIPHWNCRHLVKPGLTGWAQIRFRYASDLDSSKEKLAYDLYYIKHASILMDIQIILSTLRSIAKGSR
jgi:exopolysaccharide biosynthesis polyprenyl glycosylphosphotransferase|tara:strand:- start:146 stop:1465 length:1320 start_codon:yes stop_codon:yes gene_type:complete